MKRIFVVFVNVAILASPLLAQNSTANANSSANATVAVNTNPAKLDWAYSGKDYSCRATISPDGSIKTLLDLPSATLTGVKVTEEVTFTKGADGKLSPRGEHYPSYQDMNGHWLRVEEVGQTGPSKGQLFAYFCLPQAKLQTASAVAQKLNSTLAVLVVK